MIDNITIQRIKEAANIVDVVGDYVTLRRAGTSYKGLCPFHNEKTPSFIVTPAKNICKCFGCGGGGDSISFIMKMENLSYLDALRFLAKKFGITVVEKELTPEEKEQQTLRDKMLDANQWLSDFFERTMRDTDEGRAVGYQYFVHRGLREDIIKKFHLGYSPAEYQAYTNAALTQGIKLEHLVALGATVDTGTRTYDKYAGRVMFPIHSISGKVVGFGARTLKADKNVAKYFNPPESEVYNKSENLYGIFYARQAIIKKQKCYVVEGYADVISMHQAGVENIVAPCGTALTTGQIRLLKRVLPSVGNSDDKYVTMLYDGDSAGQHAAIKNGKLFLAEGLNVRVVTLPVEEDPDSFAQHNNADVVQKYLEENEQDYIMFKSNVLLRECDNDPMKKAAAIKDMAETISVIDDPIKRDVYSREIAPILQVEQSIIMEYVGKMRREAAAAKEKERLRGQSFSQTPTYHTPSQQGQTSVETRDEKTGHAPSLQQHVPSSQGQHSAQQYPNEPLIPDEYFAEQAAAMQGGNQPQQNAQQTPAKQPSNDVVDKFSVDYLATLNKQFIQERELMSLVVNYGGKEVVQLEDKEKKTTKVLNVVEAIIYDFSKDEFELSNPTFKLMLEEASKVLESDKNADIIKHFQNHADRAVNDAINSILSDDMSLEAGMTDVDRQFCKEKRDRELFNNLRKTIELMKREWYENEKATLQDLLLKAYEAGDKEKAKEYAEKWTKMSTRITEIASSEGRVINQSIKMETPSLTRYEIPTKAELRKQVKTRVKAMTDEEKQAESERVMEQLEHIQQFMDAKTVLLFHSLPDEICTHKLIEKYASTKKILLPVINGEDWYIREYTGDLKTGEYNIQEPTGMNFHDFDSIELVVVPGVCFDNDLGRVGRGKGYYDRMLEKITKAYKIGICFNCQLQSKVPTEKWDVKMDMVLTEAKILM